MTPRPLYETTDDLRREEKVIGLIAPLYSATYEKLPRSYGMDYALIRDGSIERLAEVKCRSTPHDRYDTYMISASKIRAAKAWNGLGFQTWLYVQFTDGIFGVSLSTYFEFKMGGRADRNDPADREIMAHIPFDRMDLILDDSKLTYAKPNLLVV